MYGEVRSWRRNNNPLLRAKDIFRRHPQKKHPQSNLSLSYSLDDLQLSCWKSGKRNLTWQRIKMRRKCFTFHCQLFSDQTTLGPTPLYSISFLKKAWYRSMSYISWILFCCCKILKTKCMQQSKTSPEVPTKRRSIFAWNMDEERRKQEMDDEVKKKALGKNDVLQK